MEACGKIGDVFKITGRGTLVIVEGIEREVAAGQLLTVGDLQAEIVMTEWPNTYKALREIEDGKRKPWVGLYLDGDRRSELLKHAGKEVEIISHA